MYTLRLTRQFKGLINQAISVSKQQSRHYSKVLDNRINLLCKSTSVDLNRCLYAHTSADKDLSTFLDKEIVLERQTSKAPKQGTRVPGFDVEPDGANLKLVRKFGDEMITIKLNVNGTVDTDEGSLEMEKEAGAPQAASEPPIPEMKARPDFSIEIKKSNEKTLVLNCSFFADESDDELAGEPSAEADDAGKGDLFQIDNFYLVGKNDIVNENDWRDNIYMGDGGLIDGEMYDLLMNYLDERGIGNEFAESLIEYCTHYEHNQYINLLDNLKQFIESK